MQELTLAVVGIDFPNADGSNRRSEAMMTLPGESVELVPGAEEQARQQCHCRDQPPRHSAGLCQRGAGAVHRQQDVARRGCRGDLPGNGRGISIYPRAIWRRRADVAATSTKSRLGTPAATIVAAI